MSDVLYSYFRTQRLAWCQWAVVHIELFNGGFQKTTAIDVAKSKRLAKKIIATIDRPYNK